MRRLLTVTALLVAASAARADFGTALDEAEKESKDKGKLMLVYIWSPQCHVCKGLNDKVWPNIAVQNELENWAAVKIEANEAVKTHFKWKIDDVPQLRVINPDGTEFRCVARGEIPEANPDKMLDFLAAIRASKEEAIASQKFTWKSTYAEAKTESKEKQKPILVYVHDGSVTPGELNSKVGQFTDPACAAAARKFVCVAATKEVTEVWDKFKPAVVPGFIFVDLEGAELNRCGLLDADQLATTMNGALDKFAASQNVDPAKKLERDIASFEAAMKGSVEQDKIDAAQRLIDAKDPKVVKPLCGALKDPSVKLKELVVAPILSLDLKNGLPVVLAWMKTEQNQKLLVKAWDAVGETGDVRAMGMAEDGTLNASSTEVSRACVRALGNMKDKRAVDILIDLPFKVKGKGRGPGGGGGVREECKRALNKVTGQDFGEDWNEWKKWWRDNQKTFKFQ